MLSAVNINSYGVIKGLLPLHVEGQWIVDSNGNRVQPRGAGCMYTAYGRTEWLEQYIHWMKETGCNVIRLGFNVPNPNNKWVTPSGTTPYNVDDMKATLNLLAQNGIYAILDDHEWAGTAAVQGYEWVLPDYEREWIDCWVSIAQTFKNNPTIAAYELENEPYGWIDSPNNDYAPNSTLTQAYYACIQAIRATGDNHIVMCAIPEGSSPQFSMTGVLPQANPTFNSSSQILPNMCVDIHDWHNYNPDDWFKDDESSNTSIVPELVVSEYIADALAYRTMLNCPVFLGEFGTYNYSPNNMDSADIRAVQLDIEMAEQYGLPWLTWDMDAWIQYAPTYWLTFVSTKLGGPFISNYVPSSVAVNQTFNMYTFSASPFNIWTYINETASQRYQEYSYNVWGVTDITVPGPNPVVFYGPCTLRVQGWEGRPDWGNITDNFIVTLSAGQTYDASTNTAQYGYTVVYAWGS